jgi:hypothetical protein
VQQLRFAYFGRTPIDSKSGAAFVSESKAEVKSIGAEGNQARSGKSICLAGRIVGSIF